MISPCSKCGGEGKLKLKSHVWSHYYEVSCQGCGHTGMGVSEYVLGHYLKTFQEMEDTAIRAWNENWETWQIEPMTDEERKLWHDDMVESLKHIRKEMWEEKNT